MQLLHYLLLAPLAASVAVSASRKAPGCPPFPSSMLEFSSDFEQPSPPLIKAEFTARFVQHKWDENVSHITTGFIENSPSKGFVLADEAFDGKLASSLFNFANVTKDGLVENILTTYSHNSTEPDVWRGYVNSNFPIFPKDLLVSSGAVFTGLVQRQFIDGRVAAWAIMYQGVIPVTVFVSNCGVVVGYEYFAPDRRTRAMTELFNIRAV